MKTDKFKMSIVDEIAQKARSEETIEVVVKRIESYGAFCSYKNSISGLLHIVDISWSRTKDPADKLKIGDVLKVKVLMYDKERDRASFGLKQLTVDPFIEFSENYEVGTELNGKVTHVVDYGIFVELIEGVEGLVHVSEIDWANKNISPYNFAKVDDLVRVKIIDIDAERRLIALSIKLCLPNPWAQFADTYKVGDNINVTPYSFTDLGAFCKLPFDIDGLIRKDFRSLKRDKEYRVAIEYIDVERERIYLKVNPS